MSYGPPLSSKSGTRYHDSELVLKERVEFLLHKIWFLAWESRGKVRVFVHDESLIAEKPSGERLWSYNSETGKETIKRGKKIGGRRIAFSSFFSTEYGLFLSDFDDGLDLLEEKISSFKQKFDSLGNFGVSDICELADEFHIPVMNGLSIDSKNNFTTNNSQDSVFSVFLLIPGK